MPVLSTADASWLAETFRRNRARFGDLRMDGTDPAPVPTPPADPPKPMDPASTPAPTPKPEDDGRAKALAEERRRAKAAEDREKALQAKVDEFEKAQLSEKERADRELADAKAAAEKAKAEAAQFQLDALKHRIAAEKQVPAALLTGSDEESLTASAEAAIAWRGAQAPAAPVAPRPDPSVGARGGDGAVSGAELYDQMFPRPKQFSK